MDILEEKLPLESEALKASSRFRRIVPSEDISHFTKEALARDKYCYTDKEFRTQLWEKLKLEHLTPYLSDGEHLYRGFSEDAWSYEHPQRHQKDEEQILENIAKHGREGGATQNSIDFSENPSDSLYYALKPNPEEDFAFKKIYVSVYDPAKLQNKMQFRIGKDGTEEDLKNARELTFVVDFQK